MSVIATNPSGTKRKAEAPPEELEPAAKNQRVAEPEESDSKEIPKAQFSLEEHQKVFNTIFDQLTKMGYKDFKPVNPNEGIAILYTMSDSHGVRLKVKIYDRSMLSEEITSDLFGEAPETRGELLVCSQEPRHPHIVYLIDRFYWGPKKDLLVEIFPFIEGQDFYYALHPKRPSQRRSFRPFSEKAALSYALQIADILRYLHAHGIVYRDLKLENLILSSDAVTVYLIDLATAKQSHKLTLSPKGTTNYAAPECFWRKFPPSSDELCKLDSFSFGILLHVFFAGDNPFENVTSSNRKIILEAAHAYAKNRTLRISLSVPERYRPLITQLLSFDSADRPTMAEALQILEQQQKELSEDPS